MLKIYSTKSCKWCTIAKDYFKQNNIEYTEYDVGTDKEKRKEMVDKSGQMGVPVLDINGDIVVGWDIDKFKMFYEAKPAETKE